MAVFSQPEKPSKIIIAPEAFEGIITSTISTELRSESEMESTIV
jgi:hypothetical protein